MNAQRGSILLYGVIALAVVTLAGGAVWSYNRALKENAQLESALSATQFALDDQVSENAHMRRRQAETDKLLARRQGERDAAAELERRIDATLGKVYRENPQARAWRDQPVPADVLRSVRNATTDGTVRPNGAGVPAGKPDGAGADR